MSTVSSVQNAQSLSYTQISSETLCADCSENQNVEWASLNRGVFLCMQCATIHRHLGRHISQVKHLSKSRWRSSQLQLVRELAKSGANYVWEYSLIDQVTSALKRSSSEGPPGLNTSQRTNSAALVIKNNKKPSSQDPMYPNKSEFIHEKYQFAAFLKRNPTTSQEDLDHQLYASVRTNMVSTSLQLLALGANPNFFYHTKGNSPLHVACINGQVLQAELLISYGANINTYDSTGQNPLQISYRQETKRTGNTWSPLIACLVEAHYEVSDTLSLFLCNCMPNHSQTINHFLLPDEPPDLNPIHLKELYKESNENNLSIIHEKINSLHEATILKLSNLSSLAFSDLCVDLYDEVDRRLVNLIVQGNQDFHLYHTPLYREYSSTRNQVRQKLAKFDAMPFSCLVWDVLWECRRRMTSLLPSSQPGNGGLLLAAALNPTSISPPVAVTAISQNNIAYNTSERMPLSNSTTTGLYSTLDSIRNHTITNSQKTNAIESKRNSLPRFDTVISDDDSLINAPDYKKLSSSDMIKNSKQLQQHWLRQSIDSVDRLTNAVTSEEVFSLPLESTVYDQVPAEDSAMPVYASIPPHSSSARRMRRDIAVGQSRVFKASRDCSSCERDTQTESSTFHTAQIATQTTIEQRPESDSEFLREIQMLRLQNTQLTERNKQQSSHLQSLEAELSLLRRDRDEKMSRIGPPSSLQLSSGSMLQNHPRSGYFPSSPITTLPPGVQNHPGKNISMNSAVSMYRNLYPVAPVSSVARPVGPGSMQTYTSQFSMPSKCPPLSNLSQNHQQPLQQQHTNSSSSNSATSVIWNQSSQPDLLTNHVNHIVNLVKHLLNSGHDNRRDDFIQCAKLIQVSVEELGNYLPPLPPSAERQNMLKCLQEVIRYAYELRQQCEQTDVPGGMAQFISLAHDIIMGTRSLLTKIYRPDRQIPSTTNNVSTSNIVSPRP